MRFHGDHFLGLRPRTPVIMSAAAATAAAMV